jgi:hypothetical protein
MSDFSSKDLVCEKCGNDNRISMEFEWGFYEEERDDWGKHVRFRRDARHTVEAIRVVCDVCGYHWLEKPIKKETRDAE